MTVAMNGAQPRALADRYLADVCGYLISQGVLIVPRSYKRSSDDHERSQIRGMDEWCIRVDRSYKANLSEGVDRLAEDTEADEREFGALIKYRSGRSLPEQYVLTDLRTFARLLRRMETPA